MRKEIKQFIKSIKDASNPRDSFQIRQNKHIKVTWNMNDTFGRNIKLTKVLPTTPNSSAWIFYHQRNLRKILAENNINREAIKI